MQGWSLEMVDMPFCLFQTQQQKLEVAFDKSQIAHITLLMNYFDFTMEDKSKIFFFCLNAVSFMQKLIRLEDGSHVS